MFVLWAGKIIDVERKLIHSIWASETHKWTQVSPAVIQLGLAWRIRKEGFKVEIYDPFFAPNTRILVKSFEFIVCTETVEHFHNPSEEFYQLNRMLDNNGFLGIMTSLIDSVSNFGDWYYRRDPTHVSFYSSKTMEWIAKKMNWKIDLIKDNVIIFYKA